MSYTKALYAVLYACGLTPRLTREKPFRPCIRCGKQKQHNNAFCSVGCKLVYDMQHKQAEGGE